MNSRIVTAALLLALLLPCAGLLGQETNFVEAKVPAFSLPDPLVTFSGKRLRSVRAWEKDRRGEILEVFSQEMYGHVPQRPEGEHFETLSEKVVYDGLGLRKVVRIYLDESGEHWFDALVHIPRGMGAVPFFAGLNFKGNDATLDERASSRWPYQMILGAGFGVVTAWRDSVEPDGSASVVPHSDDFCKDVGVRAWFNKGGDWGAISAWAWGLSRIMDYLETEPLADESKVAVIGHSRLGKAALWAGANDKRFALVVSNNSGCCGAAISRRVFGENFERISSVFPHWFSPEFMKYKNREADFPLDQNCLAALIAPRPLYIASSSRDGWADPKGEWMCASSLAQVYALYRLPALKAEDNSFSSYPFTPESDYPNPEVLQLPVQGTPVSEAQMPPLDTPVAGGSVAYHVKNGKHGITAFDWAQYLRFASRHFSR